MTINKELLVTATEKYVTNTVGNLFGISSLPAQALMKYAVRNIANKYGFLIDMFTDKDGNIDSDLLLNALKAEIKNRGGIRFMNIRFTESDIDEFKSIITQIRGVQGNVTQN